MNDKTTYCSTINMDSSETVAYILHVENIYSTSYRIFIII